MKVGNISVSVSALKQVMAQAQSAKLLHRDLSIKDLPSNTVGLFLFKCYSASPALCACPPYWRVMPARHHPVSCGTQVLRVGVVRVCLLILTNIPIAAKDDIIAEPP